MQQKLRNMGAMAGFIATLLYMMNMPVVMAVDSEPTEKLLHKVNYFHYFKNFRKIQKQQKRDRYLGVIVPTSGKLSATLFKTNSLKTVNTKVAAATICKVLNSRELYTNNIAEVSCGRSGRGFISLAELAYDIILKISGNRKTMIVSWRTECGGDSCSTKNWLFYSLKSLTSKRKGRRKYRRQGWKKEIKQRDGYFIHPAGKYYLYSILTTNMVNSPKKPQIYFESVLKPKTKLLVDGLSPSFHPYGQLIFYRDKTGSVYSTTLKANKKILIYQSRYPEKDMYSTGTAVSSGQEPVKFTRWNRLAIIFKKLHGDRSKEVVKLKVNIKQLMRELEQ